MIAVQYETTVLWTLDLITFDRILTPLTEIQVGGAILQTYENVHAVYIH